MKFNSQDVSRQLRDFAVLLSSESQRADVLGDEERMSELRRRAEYVQDMANALYEDGADALES